MLATQSQYGIEGEVTLHWRPRKKCYVVSGMIFIRFAISLLQLMTSDADSSFATYVMPYIRLCGYDHATWCVMFQSLRVYAIFFGRCYLLSTRSATYIIMRGSDL